MIGDIDVVKDMNRDVKIAKDIKADADPFGAFFFKPEGTYFCGIDRKGTYLWFNYPSLIGAWRNGLDSWTYENASQGAETIKWSSRLYNRYPQYFSVTEEGNLVDSLVQFYPWEGSTILPALYAYKTVNEVQVRDSFVLLGNPKLPIDTTLSKTLLWNGVLNPLTDNGLFPLTKAMVMNQKTGTKYSSMFVYDTDSVTKKWSYIYGTEPLKYDDTTEVEAAGLLVAYEKPQAPLFVSEISIVIDALTYNADSAKYLYTSPTFNKLGVQIMSADLKNVIASSTCAIADTTENMYFPGYQAHFSFVQKDEYGTVISDGITINEPFVVMLSGLNQAGANFGITSSRNPYYSANTYIIDANYKLHKPIANFDPYIILHGNFYTLEDYSEMYGLENYGDTINMIAKHDDRNGVYYLIHADGGLEGYSNQMIASSELLYDTTTYQYNYNIIAPDWANNIAMEWIDDDYDLWYNKNCYMLYIEGVDESMEPGTELPQVGDEIILNKFGRSLVFKIVDVDGPQGIESVSGNNKVQTKKSIREGHLIIERNGVKYNATGAKL
jgi:hypothetical protein